MDDFDFAAFWEDSDYAAPEVVADLFRVSALYLHNNDATVGISGGCTWDLEHLWGALLRKNKVVEIGGVDVAF
jgi:Domain of unknown function (DUF6985)